MFSFASLYTSPGHPSEYDSFDDPPDLERPTLLLSEWGKFDNEQRFKLSLLLWKTMRSSCLDHLSALTCSGFLWVNFGRLFRGRHTLVGRNNISSALTFFLLDNFSLFGFLRLCAMFFAFFLLIVVLDTRTATMGLLQFRSTFVLSSYFVSSSVESCIPTQNNLCP